MPTNRRNSSLLKTSAALALLAFSNKIVAQTTDSPAEIPQKPLEELDPLLVEAKREDFGGFAPATSSALGLPLELKDTPASVSTLSEQFLESTHTDRLRDALIYIPGVNVNDDGGWTSDGLLIRGFNAARYYNDGLKQVGSSIRPHFDTIERIDILKGAAGSEFGVAEPGGVINVIRKKPFKGRLYELDVSAGSYGHQHYSVDFNDELTADGSVQGRLIASYGESAEWRTGRKDNNSIYDYVVAPSVNWDYNEYGSLTFSFEHQKQSDPQDRGIIYLEGAFPGGFAPREWSWHQNSDEQVNEQSRFRVDWKHDINESLTVRSNYEYLDYGYTVDEYRNADSEFFAGGSSPYNPDGITWNGNTTFPAFYAIWAEDFQAHNFQTEFDYKFDIAQTKHTLIGGIRYYTMDSDGRYDDPIIGGNTTVDLFNPDPNGLSNNVTGFGAPFLNSNEEEEIGYYARLLSEITPRLRTLVSTQYTDYNTMYFGSASSSQTLSLRAAISYDLTDMHTVFLGYSDAYAPQAGGTRSGSELEPTHDQSVEFGLKTELFDGRALWTNSVFHTNRKDIAAADPTNGPAEFFSINFGEVEITGFESEFVGQVTDELNIRGGFAFLDSEIVKTDLGPFEGNEFANTADFQATAFADYNLAKLGLPKWTVSAGVVHVADRPGNSANNITLPDYTVLDAGLRWNMDDDTEFYFYMSNVLDETYYLSMQDSGARADQVDVGDRQLFRVGMTKRF